MKNCLCVVFFLLICFTRPSYAGLPAVPLKLHQALYVEGPENNQPSGLTQWNGSLFTVSDKHDDTIFQLRLEQDRAAMVPFLSLDIPKPTEMSYTRDCDFEGITSNGTGTFFIVSEAFFRILSVDSQDHSASWITPSLKSKGKAAGLFRKNNAYFEGIAFTGPGTFILCAERQPRGLVEVDTRFSPPAVTAYSSDSTRFHFKEGRSPDFSGLHWEQDRLYVLERNAYVVSRFSRNGERFVEGPGWSYRHIVMRPEYQYSDMKYGKAEGLCMDQQFIYIILDNNDIPRAADRTDRRPLLLILKRPAQAQNS